MNIRQREELQRAIDEAEREFKVKPRGFVAEDTVNQLRETLLAALKEKEEI